MAEPQWNVGGSPESRSSTPGRKVETASEQEIELVECGKCWQKRVRDVDLCPHCGTQGYDVRGAVSDSPVAKGAGIGMAVAAVVCCGVVLYVWAAYGFLASMIVAVIVALIAPFVALGFMGVGGIGGAIVGRAKAGNGASGSAGGAKRRGMSERRRSANERMQQGFGLLIIGVIVLAAILWPLEWLGIINWE